MAQSFTSEEQDEVAVATAEEQEDLQNILEAMRAVRRSSGWGIVEVIMKGGDVNEISFTCKLKPPRLYAAKVQQ